MDTFSARTPWEGAGRLTLARNAPGAQADSSGILSGGSALVVKRWGRRGETLPFWPSDPNTKLAEEDTRRRTCRSTTMPDSSSRCCSAAPARPASSARHDSRESEPTAPARPASSAGVGEIDTGAFTRAHAPWPAQESCVRPERSRAPAPTHLAGAGILRETRAFTRALAFGSDRSSDGTRAGATAWAVSVPRMSVGQ